LETYQFVTHISKLQGVLLLDLFNSNKKEKEVLHNFHENTNNNDNVDNKVTIKIAVAIKKKLVILNWNQDSFEKLNVRYYTNNLINNLNALWCIIYINL